MAQSSKRNSYYLVRGDSCSFIGKIKIIEVFKKLGIKFCKIEFVDLKGMNSNQIKISDKAANLLLNNIYEIPTTFIEHIFGKIIDASIGTEAFSKKSFVITTIIHTKNNSANYTYKVGWTKIYEDNDEKFFALITYKNNMVIIPAKLICKA
jgi:hypothetical protein